MLIEPSPVRQTKGTATFLVAASDAPASVRTVADYRCDGIDDQVEIQAAIDALPDDPYVSEAKNGFIHLSGGTFNVGATINVTGHTTIEGVSMHGTTIKLQNNANCDMLNFSTSINQCFFCLRNLTLNGNKGNNSSGNGFVADTHCFDPRIDNVYFRNIKDDGILSSQGWGWVLTNLVVEGCGGRGVAILNSHAIFMNCKIIVNDGEAIETYGHALVTNCQLGGGDGKYAVKLHAYKNTITSCNIFKEDDYTNQGGITLLYSYTDDNTINGCRIESKGNLYGIKIVNSGATDNLITNCRFPFVGAGVIHDNGTGTKIVNNINTDEIATGTITLQHWGYSALDSSGGAVTAILPDGKYIGQMKTIVMTDATNSSTVSVTHHETSNPEVFTFGAVDKTLVLIWTGTEWATIKESCTH